ncbi:MAG: hypothetical protein NT051_02730 [Candidatus Micrarchaeota archaeon]|nr:hypothetical protein [Candidatus Micrarchaeota archaeon]
MPFQLVGQGAPKFSRGKAFHGLRSQGATEYLVLLAVVLVIALVSIALLGFFPGTANEAQLSQSEIYWKSASPVAIVEGGAVYSPSQSQAEGASFSDDYLIFQNNVVDRIVITGFKTAKSASAVSISRISLSSGEKLCAGSGSYSTQPNCNGVAVFPAMLSPAAGHDLANSSNALGVNSNCNPDGSGFVVANDFQIYYERYIDNAVINSVFTSSKPLMLKCNGLGNMGSFNSVCNPSDPNACRPGLTCQIDGGPTYYCLTHICWSSADCTPPSTCVDAGDGGLWAYCTP